MATKLASRKYSTSSTFEEPDNNSEQYDDDCLHELQPLIEELNRLPETCNRSLPCILNPEDIHVEHVEKEFIKNIEALSDGSKRTCANCSEARRIEDMSSLQRGQHISIPGQHLNSTSLDKHKSAYRHHAIVKSIDWKINHRAQMTLIHFAKENDVMKVCEQTREFNLRFEELCIIEYRYPRYDPDVIVQRAESVLKQNENTKRFKHYNLFDRNCEHFATWCVLGEEDSLQASSFLDDLYQILWSIFGASSNIANWILRILSNSADEIASLFSNSIRVPLAVLGGCSAAYLIYCIIMTVYLIKRYRIDKTICYHCLKLKLLDRWLKFGVYGMTSTITFVIVNFALPLLAPRLAIPIGTVLVLVATVLTVATPTIRKAVWSPVQYRKKEVKTLSEMKPGDIVSLTYWYFSHLVVVSEVKWDNNPKTGTVRGIHYSLPSFFSTREIAEDTFQVDLERSKVYLVQFDTLFTFSPQEAVIRARTRIGERKWNMFSNISDHFCQWVKEKPQFYFEESGFLEDETNENTPSRSLSSLSVGKADVHLMSEIQPGDVVEHEDKIGIVVKLEDVKNGRQFNMDVIQCFKHRVSLVSHEMNLNKHYLVVHRYHPVHCVSKRDRLDKALGLIGQTMQCSKQNNFIKDIIVRHRENT